MARLPDGDGELRPDAPIRASRRWGTPDGRKTGGTTGDAPCGEAEILRAHGAVLAHNPHTRMRTLLLVCALLLLPLAVSRAAGPENAGEALLRRVGERYAVARTLSAKFRQEIPLQNVGIVRKASGTVYFARPLKMRW